MKLFGGKKGDEKAPMQGAMTKRGTTTRRTRRSRCRAGAAPQTLLQGNSSAPSSSNKVVVVQQPEDEPRPHYGIEQAITLMRALPVDQNPELVVAVIKSTLESLKVKVSDIIADADAQDRRISKNASPT